MLEKCSIWIDEIPPIEQPMRFGNKAFRTWSQKISENTVTLLKEILPETLHAAALEVGTYFTNSLGNSTRLDYGTGHETAFCAFLYCFHKLGLITPQDHVALVFKVFVKYIVLIRKLQKVYVLEPAGSHGAWSLDDHFIIIYYFGSSQLRGHEFIRTKSVRNREVVDTYADEYLYLDAVRYVNNTKSGLFHEHSPMLSDMCNALNWDKVNGGLMKMYKVEVLSKFPVMQHFLFGSLIPFPN